MCNTCFLYVVCLCYYAMFFMFLCDGELSEFLCISRAAIQIPIGNGTNELCDNIFSSYSKNCMNCDYLDTNKIDQHNVTLTTLTC